MKERIYRPFTVGLLVVITLLVSSVVASYAGSSGGHAFVGSRHFGGSRHFVGSHHFVGSRHVFAGHRRHHFFGPRVFLGVGVAAPFWYPYPYPVYSPPVVVESSPPTYIQQDTQPDQYWYYCQSSQAYYPYVKECPGGWLQVVPQSSPPSQ